MSKNSHKSEKPDSRIAALLDTLPSDGDDDDAGIHADGDADIAAFAPARPGVAEELPRLVLAAATPKRIAHRLAAAEPVAVVISAPSADWVSAIDAAVKARWPSAKVFARDGSMRSDHKPTSGNDEVGQYLNEGRPVVGISQNPAAYLPSALVSCADAHMAISAPDARLTRKLLRACAGGPTPRGVPISGCVGLAFDEIIASFRHGATGRRVLDNLARVAAVKTKATATDTTPALQNLPGYSGEARKFALELADGVDCWRRGEIAWRDLSATSGIFSGPPGTGKTLLAKSIARTCGINIVCDSMGDFFARTDGNLGDVAKALRDSWNSAQAAAPCVYFLDEIDGFPNRATLTARAREWWTPIIGLALTLFDGATTDRTGVVLLGATNHATQLDSALVRRFGRIINLALPGVEDLAAILRFHIGDKALKDCDLTPVARLAMDASAADAARWARNARALARAAGRDLTIDDLIAVIAPPDGRSQDDVRRAAVHEAGHAVAQIALGGDVDTVTIVASGDRGGCTRFRRKSTGFPTARDLDAEIVMTLAGRAAEEAFFDAPSAGAESDLARATEAACAQHASNGVLGSLLHRAPTGAASSVLMTDATLRRAVGQHVERLYVEATTLVRQRYDAVSAVADALVRRRVLTGAEVADVMQQHERTKSPRGSHE
jgi:DNA polymerase III delta prime subunit